MCTPACGAALAQAAQAPALVSDLKQMLQALPGTRVGLRDRAVLLLGFAGAFRRFELVSLDVADLEFSQAGLVVTLRKSKTDQEGKHRGIGIPYGSSEATCPVRSLQVWLAAARITDGPVFRSLDTFQHVQPARLSDKAVALIVKRRAKAVGLDPARYAGHSLRARLATSAAAAGASERLIMAQTGHRSADMVRARRSLEGLAFGDAFGGEFFVRSDLVERFITERALPGPQWSYTDDTEMALSVVGALARFQLVNQDWLAHSFAHRYNVNRGYGPAMHRLLRQIREGQPWREAAGGLFSGQGSFGNGAAMRVAPLGAYFADDLDSVIEQAALSAEVTHAHAEGIAGAIAVALAAAQAIRLVDADTLPTRAEFLDLVRAGVPDSNVRGGIGRAIHLAADASVRLAVAALGNGEQLSAQDTVPFALWCAAGNLGSLEDALWTTVSGLGDRDTTCAIAGGIISARTGVGSLPDAWHASREPLPAWPFEAE